MANNLHPLLNLINIASINVNSLISLNKRYDLLNFALLNNLDIILISETKLSERYKLQFANYDFIRVDRNLSVKGGGTAILIKKNIPYERIYTPSSKNNKILEYTIINIKILNNNFFIISLYANNDDKKIFVDELNHLFTKLQLNLGNNYYVMAGDLNSRHVAWGDRVNKKKV